MKKIRLITGASSGFGKSIAEHVLKNGDIAIGTFRKDADLKNFIKKENAFGYLLDITDFETAKNTVDNILKKFGKIDFLVNNAGIGMIGAIGELSIEEMNSVMNTNLWGAVNLTKLFLPMFCSQKNGAIIFISSQEGIVSNPGFSAYNMSKFALEGFAQALNLELKEYGIKTMIVNPGPFKTNFLKSIKFAEASGTDFENVQRIKKFIKDNIGKEPGNTDKGSELIIKAVKSSNAPLHLVLGKIAVQNISKQLKKIEKDIKEREKESFESDDVK